MFAFLDTILFSWMPNEQVLHRLAGINCLIEMIKAGKTPSDIYPSWSTELASFKQMRERYLLH